MKKIIVFVMLLGYFRVSNAQSISVFIRSPRAYALTDSILSIQVFVGSTYPIQSVTANVLGRQTVLNYDIVGFPPSYIGNISLAGLPQDTLSLQVVAIDNQNNQTVASQKIIYDRAPVLIVDSPLSWSVASPRIRIKARCIDSAGCNLSVSGDAAGSGINFPAIYPGNSIDSMLDLSNNEGVNGHINISAFDKRGQHSNQSRQIFVEDNSYLHAIFAAGDQILDFNYNKALVSNPSWGPRVPETDLNPYIYRSRVVNTTTGDSIPLPYQRPLTSDLNPNPIQNHILTPGGAIFSVADTSTFLNSIYDWHGFTLDSLGPLNSSNSLRVAGHYAIWSNATKLYLRQLQTTIDTMISPSAFNWNNDLTSTGAVIYAGMDYNIYRYADNNVMAITNGPANKWNFYPTTDGSNIVYTRSDPCCTGQHYSLRLYNGRSDSLLSDMDTIETHWMNSYQLNNGFIAYTKPDPAYHLQIWLMDASGTSSQITASAGNSSIELLNSKGDLTFITQVGATNRQRFFASRSTGHITLLGGNNGQVYYRDPDWYLVLGRMIYKIDPALYPYKPAMPQVSGLDSNYCSTEGIQQVRLLNNPETNTSVEVLLDSTSLVVAADSTISFNVSSLAIGSHSIEITYTNDLGSQVFSESFTVTAAAVPEVKLSSNRTTVTNLTEPLVVTATDVAGGGASPRYTFGGDRNFSTVLQPEGTNNVLTINPGTLVVGINSIYVRMRTSDSCYLSPTAFDSLLVIRSSTTGVIDPDFPNQPISGYPNPFENSITIAGFQTGKTYWITIRNNLGELQYQRELSGANTLIIGELSLAKGAYRLSIFDSRKNKLIGTITVLRK